MKSIFINSKILIVGVGLLILFGGVLLYIRSQRAPKLQPVTTSTSTQEVQQESSAEGAIIVE